jgi:hypothetical protein
MKREMQHQLLVNEYHTYLSILQERGLSYESLADEELKVLSDTELANLTRRLRDMARTPGVGR